MLGKELIDTLKTNLNKGTNRELASYLGITEGRISQLYKQRKTICLHVRLLASSAIHTKFHKGKHGKMHLKLPSIPL